MHRTNNLISWCSPTDLMIINDDEVHVWRANLSCNLQHVRSLWQILSVDEQIRADRFRFKEDRELFILARGMLRVILSRYLDKKPEYLHFAYNSHGKPSLIGMPGEEMLYFNVSHSSGLVMYAVTRNREVGIDIERIIPGLDYEQIARHYFSQREIATLSDIQGENAREKAFYNCWTRKEAYIKGRGEGLSLRLDQFDVSLRPGKPAKLLNHYQFPQEVYRWSLKEIRPAPGYAASLAVEGQNWQLYYFDAFPCEADTGCPVLTELQSKSQLTSKKSNLHPLTSK